MFPPGLEPGTFRVLGERDNHYTTETVDQSCESSVYIIISRNDRWGDRGVPMTHSSVELTIFIVVFYVNSYVTSEKKIVAQVAKIGVF